MRIAFFSPPFPSHLAAHQALSEALEARGHECVLIHHPALRSDLSLAPIRGELCKWTPQQVVTDSRHTGLPFGVLRTINNMAAMTKSLCRDAPAIVRQLEIQGVVADQAESAGALVAEHCGLPFVTVAAALPNNPEPAIPLPVLDWDYDPSEKGLKRNRGGVMVAGWLTRSLEHTIAHEARRLGCAPKRMQSDCLSPLADISQIVGGLDFPRAELPAHFHYVGPLRRVTEPQAATLPPLDPARPFVFCSLGTLQGHRIEIFHRVARACRMVGAQLLVAHCGALSHEQAATIDADWVVDRVDQDEAVRRADCVVSHAGLNTVLDCLSAGTPMLNMPLAFDQPAIGARLKRLGIGEILKPNAGHDAIAASLRRLLSDELAKRRAKSLQADFAMSGGAREAARIIEQALIARQPVLHTHAVAAE